MAPSFETRREEEIDSRCGSGANLAWTDGWVRTLGRSDGYGQRQAHWVESMGAWADPVKLWRDGEAKNLGRGGRSERRP